MQAQKPTIIPRPLVKDDDLRMKLGFWACCICTYVHMSHIFFLCVYHMCICIYDPNSYMPKCYRHVFVYIWLMCISIYTMCVCMYMYACQKYICILYAYMKTCHACVCIYGIDAHGAHVYVWTCLLYMYVFASILGRWPCFHVYIYMEGWHVYPCKYRLQLDGLF